MYTPEGKLKPIIKIGLVLFGAIIVLGFIGGPNGEWEMALMATLNTFITVFILYLPFLLWKRLQNKNSILRIIAVVVMAALVLAYLQLNYSIFLLPN